MFVNCMCKPESCTLQKVLSCNNMLLVLHLISSRSSYYSESKCTCKWHVCCNSFKIWNICTKTDIILGVICRLQRAQTQKKVHRGLCTVEVVSCPSSIHMLPKAKVKFIAHSDYIVFGLKQMPNWITSPKAHLMSNLTPETWKCFFFQKAMGEYAKSGFQNLLGYCLFM